MAEQQNGGVVANSLLANGRHVKSSFSRCSALWSVIPVVVRTRASRLFSSEKLDPRFIIHTAVRQSCVVFLSPVNIREQISHRLGLYTGISFSISVGNARTTKIRGINSSTGFSYIILFTPRGIRKSKCALLATSTDRSSCATDRPTPANVTRSGTSAHRSVR